MEKHLEDDFNSLSLEEIEAADRAFESARTVQAYALYFINTGKFYSKHELTRRRLYYSDLLKKCLGTVSQSVTFWIENNLDCKLSFEDTDVKKPTYREMQLIAAEIIDHWTDRKITKQINKLIGAI